MKLVKTTLAFLALLVMIGSASAQRDFAEIYKECGLGAMLFPEDPVIAVITNVTWDLGTTAVSSELTSPETCQGDSASMAAFIMDTHPQLEQDLSVGDGTYLNAMVDMMGCGGNANAARAALRASFADAIQQDDYFSQSDYQKSEVLFTAATRTSDRHCTI